MRHLILIMTFVLTFKASGQSISFYDSLDFFTRTKTKQINVDQKQNGKLFRQSTCYFDKKKSTAVWCGKLVGQQINCADTVYFKFANRDSTFKNGSTQKFFLDKSNRLAKSIYRDEKGQITSTEYYYVDSTSNRLKLTYQENAVSHTQINTFHYEDNKLIKTYELFFGRGKSSNYERTRTNLYEYYPDRRLKTETTMTNGKTDRVSEFTYVDDKN